MFELKSPSDTGIIFRNTLTSNDSINLLNFEYFYNGGGVAVGDVNNDGLQDIFFTGNMVSSKLYLNKGELKFEDVTQQAGVETGSWATGASIVDINNDGLLDIYVCVSGYKDPQRRKNLLFVNKGMDAGNQPRFEEEAEKYGLADTGYSTQAVFFDYDKDGDLDMYLATVNRSDTNPNVMASKAGKGKDSSVDRLYRNNGNNTFTNVAAESGIVKEGYGLGVAIGDVNQDGWPDIYVTNDFIYDDLLYINNQDGTFTERIRDYLKHTSHFSMGTDMADFNNDGLLDIISVDMMPDDSRRQKLMNGVKNYDEFQLALQRGYMPQYVRNNLQLNNGNGSFSEISQLAGVHYTDWSWSPLFADFDNDGVRDLFITNGIRKDITHLDFATYYLTQARSSFGSKDIETHLLKIAETMEGSKKHNFMYRNKGDLTFQDESESWGFGRESFSTGSVYADLDNDGDLDIVTSNVDEEPFVYQNMVAERAREAKDKAENRHYLRVKFEGNATNKTGIGAKVALRYGDKMQVAEQYPFRGFQSTVENTLHFGLGPTERVDAVEVTWPDGSYQLLKDVKADQVLTVYHKDASQRKTNAPSGNKDILFTEVTAALGVSYKDNSLAYVDFKLQPLLPHKYSQNGPGISVGDVNGDDLEDFYVGGGATSSGMLFLQSKDGEFRSKPLTLEEKPGEDMGSLFFDADGDGDLDLYVVSGGSEYTTRDKAYQDRLYKNDGKGSFTLDTNVLPVIDASGSCVAAADYDKDGDLDLFIGGRVQPRAFPLPAKSYLLQNNGGRFKDVTSTAGPMLADLGMVTAALWTDFDSDGAVDLIVAGEWMPLTFLKNTGGKLKDVTGSTGLRGTHGWWNSLAAGDFDNDGDMDYVAGNLGLNSRFKASAAQPVQVYAKDFDKSGTTDALMTHYIQGTKQLVHGRDDMTDQMVSLRREFRTYEDYASKSFDEIFTPERLQGAYVAKSENFQSSYIENLGKGKFRISALPIRAQFAPVCGIVVNDYDGDGNLDLLLSGNSYATEVVVGRYDAFTGLYLRGNGKGQFLPVDVNRSGFMVDADAKGMAEINTGSGVPLIIVGAHNDSVRVFQPAVRTTDLQAVAVTPADAYAHITLANGKKRKQEFYFGSGYLSQSSRALWLPAGVRSVQIVDKAGIARTVPARQTNLAAAELK
ncbi:VCBS repeat protein [Pontibacter ummariensis]|uniref:Repeat domain-containing protein n=1 Tax=Pontibacter ummariensis TaxID=1610492 RepID=A0A239B8F9_9BACT|nr:VCBS repeat-containing protein [Pontibacter ummariensis]PRY16354.1 VCBS repeat protein [Pontibacter ummariensis]SNS03658.1 Repeat domain-containing protein [Pontibacter ummariensis]